MLIEHIDWVLITELLKPEVKRTSVLQQALSPIDPLLPALERAVLC